MPYIGSSASPLPVNFAAVQAQSFNGTGSQTAFTLNRTIPGVAAIEVLVNNVQQSPYDGSYSVSGTTLTFSEAPSAGTNNVYVVYRDQSLGSLVDESAYRKAEVDLLIENKRSLTLATAVSASGTSVDFTGIPSWAKRITVMCQSLSTNGSSAYLIRLGDAGGVETTGYVASAMYVSLTSNTTRGTLYTNGFGLHWSTGSAGEVNTITMTFVKLDGNNWNGTGIQSYSVGSGHFLSGQKSLSDTLDRISITTVNGTDTFDAGTINIMYEG